VIRQSAAAIGQSTCIISGAAAAWACLHSVPVATLSWCCSWRSLVFRAALRPAGVRGGIGVAFVHPVTAHGATRLAAAPASRSVGGPTPGSYPAGLGVRVPNPGFCRGITITSLIVLSDPGALELSRGLAGLQLGVLLRSAALLGAALKDSFNDLFEAVLPYTSMPRMVPSAISWFLITAVFMSPLRGPRDLSGAAGPHPRAGLHPTVPPQGLVPDVGARDAAGLSSTTLAISMVRAGSRSTCPSPPTSSPCQPHRLRVGQLPCSGRPRLPARASIKAKDWTYAQAWASSPRRTGRRSRIRACRSRTGDAKAKEKERFLAYRSGARNWQQPGIVVVREFLVSTIFARTPTTSGNGTVGEWGVGVADSSLAPGFATTSTPPGTSTKQVTSRGTVA
jgi:hypothetical protein